MERRMLGKATTGRKRLQMLSDITNKDYQKTEAKDRNSWQKRLSVPKRAV